MKAQAASRQRIAAVGGAATSAGDVSARVGLLRRRKGKAYRLSLLIVLVLLRWLWMLHCISLMAILGQDKGHSYCVVVCS